MQDQDTISPAEFRRQWTGGSVSLRKDGRWQASVPVPGGNGKRKYFYARSQGEAWEKLRTFFLEQTYRVPPAPEVPAEFRGRGYWSWQPIQTPRGDSGPIGNGLRFTILERDKFRCRLCGRGAMDGMKLHVDHKFPKSKGGPDTYENLWTLCFDCNIGKGVRVVDFLE